MITTDCVQNFPDSFGPSKPTKRLIVDHIVLENFKSYAGRQVIGPFHEVNLREFMIVFLINRSIL